MKNIPVGNQSITLSESRLLTTRAERIAEYKKRRQAFLYQTVPSTNVDALKADGWEFDRELKTGTRLRKAKAGDQLLEDRFWSVLYLLGFEKLNAGRHFKLLVQIDGKSATKQIDAFGIDADTIVVAECKSADAVKKKSLQTALSELDSIKRPVANAIRSMGPDYAGRKIIWCMVTARIRWSDSDLTRAKEKQIQVLREQELRYFLEIAKTLGAAAKHQFEAEFLSGQKIPALTNRTVSAAKFKLGGRPAYSFVIPAKELLKRAFVNHRDLRDPSGAPTYQRIISPKRIKSIGTFLANGGYFANSILINFHNSVRFDKATKDETSPTKFGTLYLPETYKSCWVIDGQHRLYGAATLEDDIDPIIPVIAFEKLPATEEANLFAVINKEQKQVQKRLLDELDGELKWDSADPEEAAHAIAARAFDQLQHEVTGPFEDKFAPTGVPAEKTQVLTLPQQKQALVKSGLLGRRSTRDDAYLPGPLSGKNNKLTLENTCGFLNTYFSKVRAANPNRWEGGPKNLLCYNPAIQAHIRLAGEIAKYLENHQHIDLHELDADEVAESVVQVAHPLIAFIRDASDDAFRERFHVPFGSGGPARYFYRAAELIHADNNSFCPEGLSEFITGSDKELRLECDRLVPWITEALHGHVVKTLRSQYGEGFFDLAVKNKEIKKRAYEKSLDDEQGQKGLETYLDILDLKKIVEASENWPLFRETLNIQMPNQPKNLAKYVSWIANFNDVRRMWAHPFNRQFSEENVELLQFIEKELRARLG